MRVQLVVTGDLEKGALGRSLERVLRAAGADVIFDRPLLLTDAGMTSNPLPDASAPGVGIPRTVQRMARALVTETVVGRSKELPDLVVGIDDLELANIHQPHVVTAWLRRAIEEQIAQRYMVGGVSSQDTERVREALRTRCSFHLLAPLAEAYFFGENAALSRAGVAAKTAVHRVGADVEAFATDDPEFLPRAKEKNAEMLALDRAFWHEERHPKHYLEFLVGQSGGVYLETVGGVRALELLDWPAVGRIDAPVAFGRALFEDISEALGIDNPLGSRPTVACTYPAKEVRRDTLTLRNL